MWKIDHRRYRFPVAVNVPRVRAHEPVLRENKYLTNQSDYQALFFVPLHSSASDNSLTVFADFCLLT